MCRDGIGDLRHRLDGFNAGARRSPWFVLCDLDRHECAPELRSRFLRTTQARGMELRVAVRAVEAWLLADRRSFASFLGVGVKRIPREPDGVRDPKLVVIEPARESSKRVIREGLVPSETSGRRIGPAYTDEVIQYVRRRWSPNRGRAASPSLARVRAMRDVLAARNVVVVFNSSLGRAIVVPCRGDVTGISDLVAEGEWLWAAERKCSRCDCISGNWGCVSVVENGKNRLPGHCERAGRGMYPAGRATERCAGREARLPRLTTKDSCRFRGLWRTPNLIWMCS